jgi:multidrug transporter EmrE-like cation transporter
VLCVIKRQKPTFWDALFGILVGIPNYLCSRFLLFSLADVPAVVAYPTFSVGTIVCVTLIGRLCFREKLNKRKLIALSVILISLILLNL